jgi:hypothetical protein
MVVMVVPELVVKPELLVLALVALELLEAGPPPVPLPVMQMPCDVHVPTMLPRLQSTPGVGT